MCTHATRFLLFTFRTMLGNAIGASIGFYYESIGPFVTMAIIIIVLMISMGLTSLAMFNIIDIDILGDDQEYSLGATAIASIG